MTRNFGRALLSVTVLTLGVASTNSYANGISQIYTQGKWVQAKSEEYSDSLKLSGLFQNNPIVMVKQLADRFLQNNAAVLGLNSRSNLSMTESLSSESFDTIRYKKSYQGLEVVGGESLVHLSNGRVEFANADTSILDGIDAKPSLSLAQAEAIAFSSANSNAARTENAALKVILLPDASNTMLPHLVYEVTVRENNGIYSDVHFVDAHTGRELMVTSNVETVKSRAVLAASGTDDDFAFDESAYKLVYNDAGCSAQAARNTSFLQSQLQLQDLVARRLPARPQVGLAAPCNSVDQKVLVAAKGALDNSGLVYDYYLSKHGRRSIDNADMQLRSIVNFGSAWDNAAWVQDKKVMLYGAGDDSTLNDFSVGLDVAAHELTHGVTGYTAKLQYAAEPGALNESYSDVFGKLVAFNAGRSNDWKLGKELFRDGTSFVRDLDNPTVANYTDLQYKGETCTRFNDNCGVHDNSGPPTKAAVLMINALGKDKVAKIYYLTLTQLLRPASSMKEAAQQTQKACVKLFGAKASECATVTSSFQSVGIL